MTHDNEPPFPAPDAGESNSASGTGWNPPDPWNTAESAAVPTAPQPAAAPQPYAPPVARPQYAAPQQYTPPAQYSAPQPPPPVAAAPTPAPAGIVPTTAQYPAVGGTTPPLGGWTGSSIATPQPWSAPPGVGVASPPAPPRGPDIGPPRTPSEPAGARNAPSHGGGSGRAALVGGLVGALVAALVAGGLWLALPKKTTTISSTGAATSVNRPSTRIAGPSLDIHALLEKVRPSVVSIKTGSTTSMGTQEAAGSGIVLDSSGLILTNAHVISGANSIEVNFADGSTHTGSVKGSLPGNDVALVQADGVSGLIPAELGSSDELEVGDEVVAIGNALNLGAQPTVTKGIVSAKDRTIDAENESLDHLIQTDAAINPGNSGGPLVNSSGQVVGMNTAIIKDGQSLGFSLAIDEIKPLIEMIKAGKTSSTAPTAYLGVTTTNIDEQPSDVITRFGINETSGAFVAGTETGSAAANSGLQPGDVILKINGTKVAGKEDVGKIIRKLNPGDKVTIEFHRNGQDTTGEATLGQRGG